MKNGIPVFQHYRKTTFQDHSITIGKVLAIYTYALLLTGTYAFILTARNVKILEFSNYNILLYLKLLNID